MMEAESEADVRSCFCAAAISYMLRTALPEEKEIDYGFDREKVANYILSECVGYQGGFGYAGNPESHAGLTYCALGTLYMIDWKLTRIQWERCLEFCVMN